MIERKPFMKTPERFYLDIIEDLYKFCKSKQIDFPLDFEILFFTLLFKDKDELLKCLIDYKGSSYFLRKVDLTYTVEDFLNIRKNQIKE